jgi:hypothetical protein
MAMVVVWGMVIIMTISMTIAAVVMKTLHIHQPSHARKGMSAVVWRMNLSSAVKMPGFSTVILLYAMHNMKRTIMMHHGVLLFIVLARNVVVSLLCLSRARPTPPVTAWSACVGNRPGWNNVLTALAEMPVLLRTAAVAQKTGQI